MRGIPTRQHILIKVSLSPRNTMRASSGERPSIAAFQTSVTPSPKLLAVNADASCQAHPTGKGDTATQYHIESTALFSGRAFNSRTSAFAFASLSAMSARLVPGGARSTPYAPWAHDRNTAHAPHSHYGPRVTGHGTRGRQFLRPDNCG